MTAPPDSPLTDGVILLRPFTGADIPALTAACRDPDIAYRTAVPSPYTEEDAHEFVRRSEEGWRDGSRWTFAVVDAERDELLACIWLRPVEGNGQIGYWVKREARGRGVATRALGLISRWGVATVGFERLQLLTERDNIPSQRAAEKAGFRREAVLRKYVRLPTRRVDGVMYSLLREDVAD